MFATTRSLYSSHAARAGVAFITDVEGNAEYFWRCVSVSPVLTRTPEGIDFVVPNGNSQFVYGGDCCDKGHSDLRFTESLLDFKRRYGDRVHLIIGNRDSNKMRLTSELAPECVIGDNDSETEAPRWAVGMTATTMWANWAKQHGGGRASKLRWLLKHTMGTPDGFELRRRELKEMGEPSDDDSVVNSYLTSLADGGCVRRYLEEGTLATCIGDTLFVHGGLTKDNIGFVPSPHVDLDFLIQNDGKEIPGSRTEHLPEWIERLSQFKNRHLKEWIARPQWVSNGGVRERGGSGLITYGYNSWMKGHTVMTESFIGRNGEPRRPADEVVAFLKANGVSRVVVGHQPHGESPGVIRHDGVTIIFADTSFSDTTANDNRGAVHASVTITPEDTAFSGTLRDGTQYTYNLKEHPLVGNPVVHRGERFWCKAATGKGGEGEYLLTRACPNDRFRLLDERVNAMHLEVAKL